ncbi:PP2C family protein-serine/threonine phosphatase, partial [Yinghuangia sp. YIM S09857]|uniref:PP2C family protein-serine/threonine phosphatase n=1 Tax=Yinghuangia sp. YIM S09857 TaxID=3436929 RepID=UPI003F530029
PSPPPASLDGPLGHPDLLAALLNVVEAGEPQTDRIVRGTVRGTDLSFMCTFGLWPMRGPGGDLLGVGATVTDVSEDQAALTRLEQVRSRLALVNEAELRMGFSQDVVGCAEQLPLVAVPSFADAAAVGLFETPIPLNVLPEHGFDPPPGTMLRTVAATLRPGLPTLRPKDYGRLFPVPPEVRAALRRQRAELSGTGSEGDLGEPALGDTDIGPVTPDAPPLRTYLVEAGMHSRIVAPLIARGRALGAAMFARVAGSPAFEPDDVQTAEELGLRAAASVDNAQAHARQRHAVRTLQRHLLPRDLPAVSGLSLAHAYQPARSDRLAGGDWYDVVPLADDRVALVVGDVTGHGLQAAALMGQLRVAVRAVARLDIPPAALLAHVDSLMDDFAVDGELASCVYAVLDRTHRTLTWARAGHPPPLLLAPGHPGRILDGPPNALLGIGGIVFEETSYEMPDDGVVVLYSDGLVERRGYDIDTGIRDLVRTLDAAAAEADAADGVTAKGLRDAALRVLPSDPEDDVAVLVARMGD